MSHPTYAGEVIAGRYTLGAEIGRGGMGAVWRGQDATLGRVVALKRIGALPGGTTPDVFRAEREARLAAQLNHPHVVAVFDLVEDGDQHWLVMEYVEGTDLAELVKANGSLTPVEVAPILAQAADALDAAHGAGIVHRDVKPSNLLVTPEGLVKITDFGIAGTQADAALTKTGLVTGSPAYLAPEVASGQWATPASDVWSLGATLYHALVGRPPYEVGDNVVGALYRIVHEPPPRPDSAGWLSVLVESTMTPVAAERWTAAQVRDFLETGPSAAAERTQVLRLPAVETTAEVPRAPAPDRRERRTPWTLVALVAAVVLLVSAIAFAIAFAIAARDGDGASSSDGNGAPSSGASVQPTARGMETFVATYLDTVVDDPEAAFDMLTPEFQGASGGLEGYLDFWGDVTTTKLQSVDADPDALTVQYTYRYVRPGDGPTEDDVELQLQFDNGAYLIAGEE